MIIRLHRKNKKGSHILKKGDVLSVPYKTWAVITLTGVDEKPVYFSVKHEAGP